MCGNNLFHCVPQIYIGGLAMKQIIRTLLLVSALAISSTPSAGTITGKVKRVMSSYFHIFYVDLEPGYVLSTGQLDCPTIGFTAVNDQIAQRMFTLITMAASTGNEIKIYLSVENDCNKGAIVDYLN